jgi:hypothetical protein
VPEGDWFTGLLDEHKNKMTNILDEFVGMDGAERRGYSFRQKRLEAAMKGVENQVLECHPGIDKRFFQVRFMCYCN